MSVWHPSYEVCEVFGTRVESFTRDTFEASVIVEMPYQNAPSFLAEILEDRVPYPLTVHPNFSPPEIKAKAYLKSAEIIQIPDKSDAVGQGSIGEIYDYNIARIQLVYSTTVERERFTEFIEWSIESQILNFKDYVWESDKRELSEKEAPVRQVRSAIYTVVWRKEFVFVDTKFATFAGTVHDAAFSPPAFLNQTWAPETMLLVPTIAKGGQLDYVRGGSAVPLVKPGFGWTAKWLVKLEEGSTWNKYFRQSVDGAMATYEEIKRYKDDKIHKNYAVKDHSSLLP